MSSLMTTSGRKPIVVSFDYDGTTTLPNLSDENPVRDEDGFVQGVLNEEAADLMRLHAAKGDKVVIVTARKPNSIGSIWKTIWDNGLPVSQVYATSLNEKSPTLRSIGASIHYDDSPFVIDEVKNALGSRIAVYAETDMEKNLKAEMRK